jgi:hypothetical protein
MFPATINLDLVQCGRVQHSPVLDNKVVLPPPVNPQLVPRFLVQCRARFDNLASASPHFWIKRDALDVERLGDLIEHQFVRKKLGEGRRRIGEHGRDGFQTRGTVNPSESRKTGLNCPHGGSESDSYGVGRRLNLLVGFMTSKRKSRCATNGATGSSAKKVA